MTDESHEIQPAWWQPWRWPWSVWGLVVVVMLALLALLPFAVRATFLSSVPDMAEPFDEAAFVKDDIPADENAFTEYRQALAMTKPFRQGEQGITTRFPNSYEDEFKQGWESADKSVRAWLEVHRPTMVVWRLGTEKQRALDVSPGEMTFATTLEASQSLREFAGLARLDQLRCLHEGDVDEAGKLARAVYRSGGHASTRGPLVAGLIGVALHFVGSEAMARWAEHPSVTGDQLRIALAQVRADFALYESESNLLKSEFLALRNSSGTRDWVQLIGPVAGGGPLGDGILPESVVRGLLWVTGEPELTVRLSRQILTNQLREIDKPLAERRKLVGAGMAMLFDLDPAARLPGELDPAGIDRGLRTSIPSKLLLPATKQVDDSFQRFRGRQAALEAMLAAQAYRRDKGEFPESLDQLVPEYLPAVLLDPCDRHGGRILYRRDELLKATVWSVGADGNDNAVEDETRPLADVGYRLK